MGADLVAEAEPLAQLLEEAAVGIGADDVDRHAGREQGARRRLHRHQQGEIGLAAVAIAHADAAAEPAPHGRHGRGRARHAAAEMPAHAGAHARLRGAADDGEDGVGVRQPLLQESGDVARTDAGHAGDRPRHRMRERAAEHPPPGAAIDALGGIVEAAADLLHHHALFLAQAALVDGGAVELIGEQAERIVEILVEDLEGERDVLVAGVGVVLAAELGGAAVQRDLVERVRALEEHVLGEVGEAGMTAVEARAGAHA